MEQKNNCTIRYEYDGLNRIKKAILNQNVEMIYEYDAAGNITLVKRVTRESLAK